MKPGIRTHPVGRHNQPGKYVLEPGRRREWNRTCQCERQGVEQSLGQHMGFGDRVVVRCRSPLLSECRAASVDAWSCDGFAVMAKDSIEDALRVLAPLVDDVGMNGRANSIRQYALGIDDGDRLGDVAGARSAAMDSILKSVGGFSHIVQAGENGQPCDMDIRENNTSSR